MTAPLVRSTSPEETEDAGRSLAARTGPGESILLTGELGCGKTVFVRGLVAGLGGDADEVASPSFALVHEYGPPDRPVFVHVDRYRMTGPAAEDRDLGLDERRLAGAVFAVEWPTTADRRRPGWDVSITLEPDGGRLLRMTRRRPA